jgi:succinate dehydrogenase / fumarate reductase cytochrome b subunit
MITIRRALDSTVGRKYIMGASGLALVAFVIVHLLENLLLYFSGGSPYNAYVERLHSLGPVLLVMEWGLAALILVHAFYAVRVTLSNKAARPEKYAMSKSKGEPSHSNISSRNMWITGTLIFAFLLLHIWQFRFGPGMEAGYVFDLNGEKVRDLYRLVAETFHNPLYAGIYIVAMVFLGFHFRHGFWSAFQSLGVMSPRMSKGIYLLGATIAVLLAIGFIMIPIWFYFGPFNFGQGA